MMSIMLEEKKYHIGFTNLEKARGRVSKRVL